MAKNSEVYGWLVPARGPSEKNLEDVFSNLVCALCGIKQNLVRPRYQEKPPYIPAANVDWCAFSILAEGAPGASVWHEADEKKVGHSRLVADEEFSVLFSFYGPNCRGNARALRDGLWIEQNRAVLRLEHNISLLRNGQLIPVPELVNERWLKRCDISVEFVRGPQISCRKKNEDAQDRPDEGDVNIKDLEEAAPCGLCGRSR